MQGLEGSLMASGRLVLKEILGPQSIPFTSLPEGECFCSSWFHTWPTAVSPLNRGQRITCRNLWMCEPRNLFSVAWLLGCFFQKQVADQHKVHWVANGSSRSQGNQWTSPESRRVEVGGTIYFRHLPWHIYPPCHRLSSVTLKEENISTKFLFSCEVKHKNSQQRKHTAKIDIY